MKRLLRTALLLLTLTAPASATPKIIVRPPGGDTPEQGLEAMQSALQEGADALWLTLQLSADGRIVLCRPRAGKCQGQGRPLTLEAALRRFVRTPFYLDVRAPQADPRRLGDDLLQVLVRTDSLKRARVYAADARLLAALPLAVRRFEPPARTRAALLKTTLSGRCLLSRRATHPRWHAAPLRWQMTGTGGASVPPAQAGMPWSRRAVACLQASGPSALILTGVTSRRELALAAFLGADGVRVDNLRWLKRPPGPARPGGIVPQVAGHRTLP
ncbi:hypothetical protein KW818_06780 [Enterobacter quasiroggenkampii]|uniref:hypothetical protein n=1 Tax=Enterobacter quasiroggenkampii TaxID=2497436 RepID=UPI0021D306B4|nr:hypothetical protein [Enterobacter quasiroggenkampii]MCU6388826.1 hypothetical protein [Enterobacter quasiroggenkampii]